RGAPRGAHHDGDDRPRAGRHRLHPPRPRRRRRSHLRNRSLIHPLPLPTAMLRYRLLILPALLLAVALPACGGGDDKSNETAATPAATEPDVEGTVTVTGDLGKKPTIKVTPDNPTPPGELVIKDLKVGDGKEAKKGDTVSVQYVGALYH